MSMKDRVFSLYKAPFHLCRFEVYIYDAENHVVADFAPNEFRTRGWGRIQYLGEGAALFDAVDELFKKLVKDHLTDKAKCVAALNAAWEGK